MLGLPRFKLKLPSRNWLIFLTITGSFTTALLYDRHQQKKAQQRWCKLVSPLAQEQLPTNLMPRRVTIILAGPPGDSLRVAREHFHEYIKPVLVAGALDWEVIEGRREGEVRAGLAEKIRKLRRRNGEVSAVESSGNIEDELLEQARTNGGIEDWDGVQGDLVLGRHTWKEYIRGLHEGWLGPIDPSAGNSTENLTSTAVEFPDPVTQAASSVANSPPIDPTTSSPAIPPITDPSASSQDSTASAENTASLHSSPEPSDPAPSPKKNPSATPPYILPPDYATATISPSTPPLLTPTLVLPLPHLLGFLNTPTRVYRFLTRRYLADETGASVAALVLATKSRPYISTTKLTSSENDTSSPSSSNTNPEPCLRWEQEDVLRNEEAEWHKIAWADDKGAENEHPRDRVWREDIIIDNRIGERMRVFELDELERERALREEQEMAARKRDWLGEVKAWFGIGRDEGPKGWEMGLVESTDD